MPKQKLSAKAKKEETGLDLNLVKQKK